MCVPLHPYGVSKAIEEAKYALDVLKADGIKLATNVGGQYLGAPDLAPFRGMILYQNTNQLFK